MKPAPEHVTVLSPASTTEFPTEWYELNAPDHFWFQWRFAALRQLLEDLKLDLRSPARVLDVGCGVGTSRAQVESATRWTVDGIDLNLHALSRASQGRGKLFLYDLLEQREQFLQAYDVLLLLDVLEHIESTRPFLDGALKHLRPGGIIIINVPALQCLHSGYDVAAGHFRRYNLTTLRGEFDQLAVKIESARYWGLSLVPLLLARKWAVRKPLQTAEIIRRGFRPPRRWINSGLSVLGKVETTLLHRPPLGTSVLLAARKNA